MMMEQPSAASNIRHPLSRDLFLEKIHFKILKTIATSGFPAALECTKFVLGRPGPHWGSLQRSLRPAS